MTDSFFRQSLFLRSSQPSIPKISKFSQSQRKNQKKSSLSLTEAYLIKIREQTASHESKSDTVHKDKKNNMLYKKELKTHQLNKIIDNNNNSSLKGYQPQLKESGNSLSLYLLQTARKSSQNQFLSASLPRSSYTPTLNNKSKLIIVTTLSKDKNSITEQKVTAPDSSSDVKIPTHPKTKNAYPLSLGDFSLVHSIKPDKAHLPLVGTCLIKEKITDSLESRCLSAHFNKNSVMSLHQDNNNQGKLIELNQSSHRPSHSFRLSSSKQKIDCLRNIKQIPRVFSIEDSLNEHCSHKTQIRNSISLSKHSSLILASTNIKSKIKVQSKQHQKKKHFALKHYKHMNLLTDVISQDILDQIDAKRSSYKVSRITQITKEMELAFEFSSNQKHISNLRKKTVDFAYKHEREIKNEEFFILKNKSIINSLTGVINLEVSLFKEIANQLNEKYYFEVYHRILKEYASTLNKDARYKRMIRKKEGFIHNLKIIDLNFNSEIKLYHNQSFPNHLTYNNNRVKAKKQIHRTTIDNNLPFQKPKFHSKSLNLRQAISSKTLSKFVNVALLKKPLAHDPKITLLKTPFFSRGSFDVTKIKEVVQNIKLRPIFKAKNIQFHIIDEQEEMKKNKNMSKESLVFRTQEIKMRMKEKLNSVEEILFFLIQEGNFKEFRKILEQFHLSLESKDSNGNTFLLYAVECSFTECVKYLIQIGADINAVNLKMNTPLHIALIYQNYEIADLLLKNGANETLINKSNLTPWQCLVDE